MNSEQREKIWISLGLNGILEFMDASCTLAERLEEKHIHDNEAYRNLMSDIAAEIINKREEE